MDDVLKLPATMDAARARSVFVDLSQRRGKPLTIDASQVEKASALALEVIIAGKRQWQLDGNALEIVKMSEALMQVSTGLGLDQTLHMPQANLAADEGSAP